MKRILLAMTLTGLVVGLSVSNVSAQRGGRGGGRGGGGFTAPAMQQRPSAPQNFQRPSAPPTAAPRSAAPTSTSGTGPRGGSYQGGTTSGSHTTQGGATVTYKGAAAGGTTGGGASGAKYVGGVQVTTANGQTINHVGKGGAATGPGGNTVAGRAGATGTYGPQGSGVSASRGAVATGPAGTAGYRGGVAVGPNGAGAYRQTGAVTAKGTYYRSAAAVTGQGTAVRSNFQNFAQQYPALTARWVGPTWRPVAWSALASYGSYPAESTSYDYGSSVVYQDDAVYVNGDNVGTPEQYAEQAATIAEEGRKAEAPKDDEWQSLGVFAMVQGEETTSSNIFQLSVNKAGVIRGEYYNALTDTTEQVFGQVDKKTQRAAWTVGDKKTPTYEAGIVNLTEEQTTMMVHYSKSKSQQFSLIRIEQPTSDVPMPKP